MSAADARSDARVELVTIGDELLLGEMVDENGAWLGRRLARAGLHVRRRVTVGDDADAIGAAVGSALDRTGTVLCTGGLGPTRDDQTKTAVARLLGRRLRLDEEVLESIRRRFDDRDWTVSDTSRSQAEVPENAVIFPNEVGTAPGLALEDAAGRTVVLLPGVPREMRVLVEQHVLPFLLERRPRRSRPVRHRTLRTTGIPESEVAARVDEIVPELAPLRIAFLPTTLGVDLRVTSRGELDDREAEARLDVAESRLRGPLEPFIYGQDDTDLVDAVAEALVRGSYTLAVAESCTGGLVGARLTDRPGASAYLLGVVVAYADEVKRHVLGIEPATLAAHGAVSEATARAMLGGVRILTGADAAISVTGIAGPGGGSPEKPVGTVWYGAAVGGRERVRVARFGGERQEVRERSAQAALASLWRILREEGS